MQTLALAPQVEQLPQAPHSPLPVLDEGSAVEMAVLVVMFAAGAVNASPTTTGISI